MCGVRLCEALMVAACPMPLPLRRLNMSCPLLPRLTADMSFLVSRNRGRWVGLLVEIRHLSSWLCCVRRAEARPDYRPTRTETNTRIVTITSPSCAARQTPLRGPGRSGRSGRSGGYPRCFCRFLS